MDNWDDENEEGEEDELLRDNNFGGKDAVIFVVDASTAMHVKPEPAAAADHGGEEEEDLTPFRTALRAIGDVFRKNIFASPNDLLGVLLYGTEKQVEVRDFKHLSLLLPLDTPEAEAITKLEKLSQGEEAEEEFLETFGKYSDAFSLHEALWLCQSLFANAPGKVGSKTIILMTCNDDPHANDRQKQRQAKLRAGDLFNNGVTLEVLPFGVGDSFKMDKFFQDLVQLADDVPYDAAPPVRRFEELTKNIRKRIYKKRSVGRVEFDLGGGVKIAVAAYNFIQKATKPGKVKLARDTNDEVKTKRTLVNQGTGALLLPSDINKFQEYGGKRIKFTTDETKSMMMMDGKLGLRLCGFKPISSLKWGQFVRSGYFIYPDEKSIKGSRELFAALLIKSLEKKVLALCSYKPRHTSGPSFVALVPQASENDEAGFQRQPAGFQLVFLPFADDLRNVPDVRFVEPQREQKEAAKKVIKKLRINYHPESFENPDLQAHFNLIEGLALGRDDIAPHVDLTIPPLVVQENQLKVVGPDFLATVYPESYNPEAPPKRKAKAPPVKKEPAPKKAKVEVDQDTLDMGSYVEAKTVNKLTVPQLKGYLQSMDIKVNNLKKAELVEEVYKYYKK